MNRNVMFSGGIPADGPEEVFSLISRTVGERAISWPDGETNPERRGWIAGVNREVLAKAPCFERIENDYDRPDKNDYGTMIALRIKHGVNVDLKGRLPYAKDAIASYRIFKKLKDDGTIPSDTRFQVAVPGAHDVISISFPDAAEWPKLFEAWEDAVQEEYRRILEVIPAHELCVQIDFCTELCHIGGSWAKLLEWVPDEPQQRLFERYTSSDYIRNHIAGLPREVRIGFHICCGTSPYYPVQPLDTIALTVDLSNAIQQAAEGRIDYFHLPAMQDSDNAYFKPLEGLDVGDADIYLGLECNDGLEPMKRRIDAARNSLADFGVAHYCGYFWNKAIMPELMQVLAQGADYQNSLDA